MGKQPGHADFETNPQSSQFEFLPDRNQLEKKIGHQSPWQRRSRLGG